MKKTMLSIISIMLGFALIGQTPQGISHQAVIRNAANELVANSPVGIRVSILQGAPDSTEVYAEVHTPVSNANGLITFVIGQGNDQSSDFSAIDWAGGPYFVKTEADPQGGINYTIEGISQLWSVPYALSAGTTGGGFSYGDSLVLKDQEGMTRFVINPNTGEFKMMNNDTVWHSLQLKSPSKKLWRKDMIRSWTDNDGRYVENNLSSGWTTTYANRSKQSIVREEFEPVVTVISGGTVMEDKKYYDNGMMKEHEKSVLLDAWKGIYEKETIEYNEDGTIFKSRIIQYDRNFNVLKEEDYIGSKKKSQATFESTYSPDMGFENKTVTTETYQGDEVLVKKDIESSSLKNSAEEKYEEKAKTTQFYKDGVKSREVIETLLDQWDETIKTQTRTARMFDPSGNQVSEIKVKSTSDANYNPMEGSMSRSNTTEMSANGVKIADQNRSMEHYPDPSNYTEDSESTATYMPDGTLMCKTQLETITYPGVTEEKTTKTYVDNNNTTIKFTERSQNGTPLNNTVIKGGVYREQTTFTNNDNLSKSATSFKNPGNTTTAKLTEEFNKDDALHTKTIEQPGLGSTTISQGPGTIELQAGVVAVSGDLDVTGDLNVAGTKNFCIDHPNDPDNKYLVHAAIESSEALNQYSGNIITDNAGFASVSLPDYFKLINIDFRYQLTILGDTFARAIIYGEIDENNRFVIKTDEPNIKVSWQVTAKRNDQYLINNPFSDVVDK
jgi:hypothetical protein